MDTLKKIGYIFGSRQKKQTVWLIFLMLVGTGFELLGVSAIQPLVQSIMNVDRLMQRDWAILLCRIFHIDNTTTLILLIFGLVILLYLVKNAFLIFMYYQQYKYIYSNMRELSSRMMHSYLGRPYSYFKKKSSAELLRNINQDVADYFGVIQATVQLATETFVVLALIIYLFLKDKSITLAVGLVLGVVILLFQKIYKTRLVAMGNKNRHYEAQVNKWIQQAFGGIKEVKVMNREQFFYDEYDAAFQGRVRSEYTYHTMVSFPKPLIEAVCIASLLGASVIKILHGTQVDYLVPTLSTFLVAAYRMLPSFNRITEYLGTIAYQKPAVTAIYKELREIESFEDSPFTNDVENVEPLPLKDAIRVEDVSFHYADADKKILDHVTFDMKKNTSTAFIGASGAGKTTMADLILGVLEPTEGHIRVDETDIFANLNRWHRTIGYVPQSIYLLDDTIEANVAFGIPEDKVDHERVLQCMEKAQLSDMLKELPNGIRTVVGEQGVRFSGGQRQRIGIARALYLEPEVLILDEATSALDNETENAVMESIDALHGEMTMIIIAHRLSTIRNCDCVYKIGDGKAVRVENPNEERK